jgi:hypothetical protein
MNASRVLSKSTEEALSALGRPSMQSLIWQMSKNGVDMAPDNFDINKFAQVLRGLLGEGSETVLNMIYMNLCRHLKINLQADQDLPALEKISKIIEAKKRS